MKNRTAAITQGQIDQALRRIRQRGGMVRKVPDEGAPMRRLAGAYSGTWMASIVAHWSRCLSRPAGQRRRDRGSAPVPRRGRLDVGRRR